MEKVLMMKPSRLGHALRLAALGAVAGASLMSGARAADIGHATTVEKTVTGIVAGQKAALKQGDAVFKDEVIETAAESLARLEFRDATKLFIGPSSRVTLDKFVYNPDDTASKLVVAASKGAFRFISGKSEHSAYEIRTPFGSLGVNGTTLGFVIADGRMVAVLKQGAMLVCPHRRLSSKAKGCVTVDKPDMAVIVTRTGASGPVPKSSDMRDFGDICGDICKRLFPQ
jgi:hypothetical protein